MSVLVVLEERGGKISRISWEALAAGQHLAAPLALEVVALVIGVETERLANEVSARNNIKMLLKSLNEISTASASVTVESANKDN